MTQVEAPGAVPVTSAGRGPEFSVMVSGLNPMAATHPSAGVELVKYAEAIGLDEYLFGDHVVLGGDMSSYPYGQFGYGDTESGLVRRDEPCFPDLLALLAAAAVSTKRIRLGSGILLAALRQPVVLAKMLGTIDQLSDGRFVAAG